MNIIKAFNGTETQGIPTDETVMKYLHQYNMAQVAYKFRVVIQQPMAITRAAIVIDYSSIVRGLKLSPKAIQKNIQEMISCNIQKLCYTDFRIGNGQRINRKSGRIERSRFFFCIYRFPDLFPDIGF